MHRRHGIRANLPANQEGRSTYKRRAKQHGFGVYRPLTDESSQLVWEVLGKAKEDIKSFFGHYRHGPAELAVPVEMGVTFVPRRKVGRALRHGLLERLELARLIERIESHNEDQGVALDVTLTHTDWYSDQERKLVYCFTESEGKGELEREANLIGRMLGDSKAHELDVLTPDHLTLMKYGHARDGRDLSRDHKDTVGEIVETHFRQAEVQELYLGRLVIGDSYSQPRNVV